MGVEAEVRRCEALVVPNPAEQSSSTAIAVVLVKLEKTY